MSSWRHWAVGGGPATIASLSEESRVKEPMAANTSAEKATTASQRAEKAAGSAKDADSHVSSAQPPAATAQNAQEPEVAETRRSRTLSFHTTGPRGMLCRLIRSVFLLAGMLPGLVLKAKSCSP